MLRSNSIKVGAVAVLAALSFSACGGGGADKVEPATYVTSICTSVGEWVTVIQEKAGALGSALTGEASQAKEQLDSFLGDTVTETETLLEALAEAGVPDVDGGEELAQDLIDTFEAAKEALQDGKDQVADLPEDDPEAFAQQAQTIGTDIQTALTSLGTTLDEAPEALTKAAADEPKCQTVGG